MTAVAPLKFVPVITTLVPTPPLVGLKLETVGGAGTVQVKLALPGCELGSVAVTVTEYGLPDDAPAEIVPLIVPVPALIVRPGGRPVAEYASVSPSGSVAEIGSVMLAPSELL